MHVVQAWTFSLDVSDTFQVATMIEMRKSEAKESEVNHRFAEHAQW